MLNSKHSTVRITFSCHPNDIIYVNSIIDSYGNLGLLRTVDKKKCNCAVFSTQKMSEVVLSILEALKLEGVAITEINIDETEEVDF